MKKEMFSTYVNVAIECVQEKIEMEETMPSIQKQKLIEIKKSLLVAEELIHKYNVFMQTLT
jgi:hypothetical protein